MPAWALLIVVVREFAVSGLRLVAVDNGRVIAAGLVGEGQDRLHHGGHLPDAPAGPRLGGPRGHGRDRRPPPSTPALNTL